MHCDLSVNNVLLIRKSNESEAIGLLIDYDYSLVVDLDSEAANQAAASAANASGTHAAEDTSIGENVAVGAEKAPRTVRCAHLLKCQVITIFDQGTPPYMAIEALLGIDEFVHKPQHDLESILYIILYICTFVQGPGLPLDIPHVSLPIRSWLNNNESRDIGYCKLALLECYDIAILPHFTPYWHDLTPFVEALIIACFPLKARLPNNLRYEQALRILEKAYDAVEEPPGPIDQASKVVGAQCLKRPSSTPLHRNPKKGKCTLFYS